MTTGATEAPVNQSVERAARLLGLFSIEEPALSLADITQRLGTSKATTHRYATALRRAGLLRYSNGLFTLGPRVVELAASALAGLRVVEVAGPFLARLVEETNETAVLSVWDGAAPVVVRIDDSVDRLVQIRVPTGARLPLDSAQGKVFRAFLGEAGDELDSVREHALAFNTRVVEGIAALAAPVFQGEEIVATIAIVGTTAAISDDPSSKLARSVCDVAQALSAELGFLPIERRE